MKEERLETIKMIGDGLQAKIYSTNYYNDGAQQCAKVFEPTVSKQQLVIAMNELNVSRAL